LLSSLFVPTQPSLRPAYVLSVASRRTLVSHASRSMAVASSPMAGRRDPLICLHCRPAREWMPHHAQILFEPPPAPAHLAGVAGHVPPLDPRWVKRKQASDLVDHYDTELDREQHKVTSLEGTLNTKNAEHSRLGQQRAKCETDIASLDSQIAQIDAELRKLKQDLALR
jgi:hypothetical protein